MTDDLETRIRERAHEIWKREGSPEGQHDEHWKKAEDELRVEFPEEFELPVEGAPAGPKMRKGKRQP